jgi:membrane protein implicated in regulation of membrane protease activity
VPDELSFSEALAVIVKELGPWLWFVGAFLAMLWSVWRAKIYLVSGAIGALAIGCYQIWAASQGQTQLSSFITVPLLLLAAFGPYGLIRRTKPDLKQVN